MFFVLFLFVVLFFEYICVFLWNRSVEEVSTTRKHREAESTTELDELVPIEERSRSGGAGSTSGASIGGAAAGGAEEAAEERRPTLPPEVTSPDDDGSENPEEDFEHIIIETSREKVMYSCR